MPHGAWAEKIVGRRPFERVDELLSRKLLSRDVFDTGNPLPLASQ